VDSLSPESRAVVQAHSDDIIAWVKAVQAYNHADPPPGWKLVEGSSRRKIDEEQAAAVLDDLGVDAYEPKFIGLSKAEKALGKNKHLLDPAISRTEPKPVLATADDARPAFCPFPAESEVDSDEL